MQPLPRRRSSLLGLFALVALVGWVTPKAYTYLVSAPTDRDTIHAGQVQIAADSLQQFGGTLARRLGARIDSLEVALLTVATTPPPPPPPPPPVGVQPPTDTVPLPIAPTTCTKMVNAGANLQTAINSAVSGDVLCLASSTWNGPITLPVRADTNWVVIRPQSTDAAFAQPGTRIRPTTAVNLPKIQGSGTSVIATANGAIGWRLIGLEIKTTGSTNTLALIGSYSASSLGQLPRKIAIERSFLHSTTTGVLRRCVALNGTQLVVVDSWLEECHENGTDSQAINGCTGTGKYRISNNHLNSSGEVIMFGGCDPAISNLVAGDITIRRNYLYMPGTWKNVWAPIKSRFELKSAVRVEFSQNVIDGAWVSGHNGEAVAIKSADQNGGCHNCRSSDITIQDNWIKQVGRGIYIVGKDNTGSASSRTDSVVRRVAVLRNYLDSLNVSPYTSDGQQFNFIAGSELVEMTGNTVEFSKSANSYFGFFYQASPLLQFSVNGLTASSNIFQHGQYGVVSGCPTNPAWTQCATSVTFGVNGVVGSGTGGQPTTLVPNAIQYSTTASALAAGLGVSRASIIAKTAGVVVPR